MTTPPAPIITDDIMAEIEAEFRACHANHRDIIIEPEQAVALVGRLREDERDAARYKVLREDPFTQVRVDGLELSHESLDTAIDAAMKASQCA